MKNIVLFCAAGMSTTLLVERVRAAAKEAGYECRIAAYPVSKAGKTEETPDMVMLGPQVRYHLPGIREKYPDIPVEAMDIAAFGMMDGRKIISRIKEVLGE